MRICHVVESAGAGTGQVVCDLARLQKAQGHDVTVIYAPERAEALFLKTLNAIEGLRILQTPMRRSVGPHDAAHAVRLWRLLSQNGPFDILHGHSSKAGALTRLVGVFLPKTKIVYTPHAFVTMGKDASPLFRIIEWFLQFFTDAIIATSDMEKTHGVSFLKIKADKLHVVPNGIRMDYPADRQAAREGLGLSQDAKVMGFVGRLAPQKNLPRLLDVFDLCRKAVPSLRLVILGDGGEKEKVENNIAAQGWEGAVTLVSGLNARDYYPAFDVFVNSSDYESFGLTLVEAMDAGVPVVTTPVGIAPDAIEDGKTGFIGTFDAETLAQGVLKVFAMSDAERQTLTQAAREKAKAFSDEEAARRTMGVYEGLERNKTIKQNVF